MTTIRHRGRRRPFVAGAAVFAALAFSLTACAGGTGANGEYVKVDGTSYYLALKINGSNVTLTELKCDDSHVAATNLGTFSKDKAQIVWSQRGIQTSKGPLTTDSVSFTAAPGTVTIGGETYVAKDSDQGKAVVATVNTNCTNN
ncbi:MULTISPECIES: hypothetical protein [Arthrobacter]|uniref:Lipoprotein n=1 Tax=Arthrobacter terricola TaxID=2547396 RepID=A0A4R5K6F3_9MICC|nr:MULTISPECIES: hypothetical protein [Arthrobacter]MBT8163585.1 hypothetical protein [Arthrobacter sp. GN70]TDF88580.1 hypothetical protein E1809_23690 [Arthrobacter terricola]